MPEYRKLVYSVGMGLWGWLILSASGVWGEEFTNIVQTKNVIIKWAAGTDWSADYPTEATGILHLYPAADSAIARAIIVQGTVETVFSAKNITYYKGTGNFLLEGDCRIEQGERYMSSPVSIEYDAVNNWMKLLGQPNAWAKFRYTTPDGPTDSIGREIQLYFESVSGKQIVKKIVVIGNQGTTQPIGGQKNTPSVKPPSKRQPKLSSPR